MFRLTRRLVAALAACLCAGGILPLVAPASAVAIPASATVSAAGLSSVVSSSPTPSAAGAFTSLPPARVLDTRSNLGGPGPVPAGGVVHLTVLGRGGVPGSGVSAVVMNVTVVYPKGSGFVTVWPDGTTRPTASNLNFVANQTVPNLVVVKVGANGAVALQNSSGGTVQLLADVAGYYLSGTPGVAGAFTSLAPTRVLDTRSNLGGAGPVPVGGVVHLTLRGRGGVPLSGVSAVVMNVTVVYPKGSGFVTVWPDGTTRPTASNLNFVANQTVPNLVVVKVGANGAVALQNSSGGTVQLLADVAGYYLDGTPGVAGAFTSLAPARVLDTRSNLGGAGPVPVGGVVHLGVLGHGGVPGSGVSAVVMNVTVVYPKGSGFVTVWPDGTTRPTASNLNFVANQTVPNLVVVKVGTNGAVALQNSSGGTVQLLADVAGYYLDGTPSPVTAAQAATASATSMDLSWANPTTGPFTGVVIRRATGTTPPPDAGSGTPVTTTAGATTSFTDTGLTAGTTYSYALFATDGTNFATPATLTVNAGTLTWGAPSTVDHNTGGLSSISCPTTAFCAAVDSSGNALTFNGSTWTTPTRLDTVGYAGHLTSVSCPSASFCAAVDSGGNAETYNGSSWSAPQSTPGHGPLTAVSCPSASFCAAVDGNGKALTFNGSTWGTPTSIDAGSLSSVSCPSTTFCAAVDGAGKALTYNGTAWSVAAAIDGGHGLTSVSCPSASFCAAVDSGGNALTFNGTAWSLATSVDGDYLSSVSCPTASACVAVDINGNAVTFNGTIWAAAVSVDSGNTLASVSCPTASACVAVEPRGKEVTYNGTVWSSPTTIDSNNGPLSAVSCPAPTFCAAVDHSGNALTFNGAAWSAPSRISVDLYSVSCPTSSFCAAVDADGDALVFNGASWSAAHIDGDRLTAVSCASTSFCAAVDGSGKWAMFDGTGWSVPSSIDGFQALTSVSCSSATFCAAVDASGNAVTFNGSTWGAPAAIDGPNGSLSSVSCPTRSFCVAGDGAGRAVTFNGSTWVAPVSITSDRVSSVSCPSTSWCSAIDRTGHAATFNGSTWSVPTLLLAPTMSPAVSCASAQFCMAVESTRSAAILGTNP